MAAIQKLREVNWIPKPKKILWIGYGIVIVFQAALTIIEIFIINFLGRYE
jgi:hypothetical protein